MATEVFVLKTHGLCVDTLFPTKLFVSKIFKNF